MTNCSNQPQNQLTSTGQGRWHWPVSPLWCGHSASQQHTKSKENYHQNYSGMAGGMENEGIQLSFLHALSFKLWSGTLIRIWRWDKIHAETMLRTIFKICVKKKFCRAAADLYCGILYMACGNIGQYVEQVLTFCVLCICYFIEQMYRRVSSALLPGLYSKFYGFQWWIQDFPGAPIPEERR